MEGPATPKRFETHAAAARGVFARLDAPMRSSDGHKCRKLGKIGVNDLARLPKPNYFNTQASRACLEGATPGGHTKVKVVLTLDQIRRQDPTTGLGKTEQSDGKIPGKTGTAARWRAKRPDPAAGQQLAKSAANAVLHPNHHPRLGGILIAGFSAGTE